MTDGGIIMDKTGFKLWLINNNSYSSQKQIYDCLSRASRVEKELARGIENFTYEKAFAMDNCKDVLFMISHMGKNIPFQTTLPIGSRQIAPIMAAARKYILYLQFAHEK